jgi:hypothetical protein
LAAGGSVEAGGALAPLRPADGELSGVLLVVGHREMKGLSTGGRCPYMGTAIVECDSESACGTRVATAGGWRMGN